MNIETLSADSSIEDIVIALSCDGAVVVNELAPSEISDMITQDLRSHFDDNGTYAQCDFNGYKTLRLSAVLNLSKSSANLIGHDKMLRVIDAILLPHCVNYRIGSTTAIEILPGEKNQILHQDDAIYPARIPGLEWQMSVMWALTDFTKENGTTRLVPGSHRGWLDDEISTSNVIQKPMKKGSALFYLGSTLHGGGANRSKSSRIGLVTTYALGWLRQEVNQYLTIPIETAKQYPEKIQRLLGYQSHGPNLGKFPEAPDGGWFLKDEGRDI